MKLTKTQKIVRIAVSLSIGPTSLTDQGLRNYVAYHERVLSESWQHPSNKRNSKFLLEAGRKALEYRGLV